MKETIIIHLNPDKGEYKIETTLKDRHEIAKWLAACTADYIKNLDNTQIVKPEKPN
jgi:hypothetical protein